MTIDTSDLSFAKATRALERFRAMLPTLTSFAQAIADDERVVIEIVASNGASYGTTIYLAPPIELGNDYRHERSVCDKRDDSGLQQCLACRTYERIMATLFHEIAHIVFNTFEKFDFDTWQWLNKREPDKFKLQPGNGVFGLGYMRKLDPYAPLLLNALEDARVNAAMFEARPGVKGMYDAELYAVADEGVPDPTSKKANVHWRDMDADFQVILGASFDLCDFDYSEWLHEEIIKDLEDDELRELFDKFPACQSVQDTGRLTYLVHQRLREMGYFKTEERKSEEEDSGGEDSQESGDGDSGSEPGKSKSADASDNGDSESKSGSSGDDSEGDESSPGESSDGSSGDDSQDEDGESKGDDSDESDSSSESGSSSGEDRPSSQPSIKDEWTRPNGDPEKMHVCLQDVIMPDSSHSHDLEEHLKEAIEKNIEIAIQQADYFDKVSHSLQGVTKQTYGSLMWPRAGSRARKTDEGLVGRALMRLRAVLDENKRAHHVRNLKRGKINTAALGKRVAVDDPRIMRKKTLPGKRDYAVVIGVDQSGSTTGRTLQLEIEIIMAEAEMLHRLGIPFSIIGHSGSESLYIWEVKTFDQPWDNKARERLSTLGSFAANYDGHALEYLRKRADEAIATDKIILYHSDGSMPAENYHEELGILQREIKLCARKRYTLLGVGIHTDSPKRHGLETVIVTGDKDILAVIKMLEKHLKRALTSV